jgi:hypothetical protein
MPRELQYDSAIRPVVHTLYAAIFDSQLQVWDGTVFVELATSPAPSACCITMTLLAGSSTLYWGDLPEGIDVTQSYTILYFDANGPTLSSEIGGQQMGMPATIDGLPLAKVFRVLLACSANKTSVNPNTQTVTFYARDGVTAVASLTYSPTVPGQITSSTIN